MIVPDFRPLAYLNLSPAARARFLRSVTYARRSKADYLYRFNWEGHGFSRAARSPNDAGFSP